MYNIQALQSSISNKQQLRQLLRYSVERPALRNADRSTLMAAIVAFHPTVVAEFIEALKPSRFSRTFSINYTQKNDS